MMVNRSTFSKGPKNILVYNIIIILTVTYNYTNAEFENDPGAKEDDPVSYQHDLQNKENLKETVPAISINRKIQITEVESDEIRESIKLGIQYALQTTSKEHEDVLYPSDFTDIEDTEFKSWSDTYVSPVRHYKNFIFITYGRKAFCHIRRLFDINSDDYRQSFCNSSLRKIPNPGASASVFYFTEDDKFIMKSVQLTEFNVLKNLLPTYKNHMEQNPGSLLPKFSGLFGYKSNLMEIKLISMNNLLPSKVKIHLKYDLKGSTYKRTVSTDEMLKRMPTFKDLDFREHFKDGLYLMPHTLSDLIKNINNDCNLLKSFHIMDYSLLVGIYKIEKDDSIISQAASARWKRLMVDSIGMESILADTGTFPDENVPSLKGSIPAKSESGEKLLLFLGIIDILQEYRITKVIERGFKIITQSKNVSVQDPDTYATRLLNFSINNVFKPLLIYEESESRSERSFDASSSKQLNDDDIDKTCVNCFKQKKSKSSTIKNDLN